jgi:DNA-binding NarL/FixJ family response regulator
MEKATSVTDAPAKPPVRILVVDDHGIVREALAAFLAREPGFEIVGAVATGEEAVIEAERLHPDVILMDLVLPSLNGIDAMRPILNKHPDTQIIALSACHSPEQVSRALRAGAHGYVLKSGEGGDLLRAVAAVTSGHQYVSPALVALFGDCESSAAIPESPFDRLSARERDVLRRIVAGSTSSEIADQLSLSRKTVETYRGRMMVKLGVANRAALIRMALDNELPSV